MKMKIGLEVELRGIDNRVQVITGIIEQVRRLQKSYYITKWYRIKTSYPEMTPEVLSTIYKKH